MRAACLLRPDPHYRPDVFRRGLERVGAKWVDPGKAELLVIWNRTAQSADLALQCESRGGTVLVAENGYLGVQWRGAVWYALSIGQHNGAGRWPDGGPERWDRLGVELAPFRHDGTERVLLPQRGIGAPGVRMPSGWTMTALRQAGKPARVRAHPGMRAAVPLEQDLAQARSVLTWGSGAALKALAMGIPCFHSFPKWIGAAASRPVAEIRQGELRDEGARLAMFRRLAWAMWRIDEIESGEAFARLLSGL